MDSRGPWLWKSHSVRAAPEIQAGRGGEKEREMGGGNRGCWFRTWVVRSDRFKSQPCYLLRRATLGQLPDFSLTQPPRV